MKIAICFVCFILVCKSSAQVAPPRGAHVPNYMTPMPYYFAGTYNVASGVAVPTPFSYVTSADLLISQNATSWTLLKHYENVDVIPMTVPLSAPFDSTHFDNGQPVYVKLVMTDSSGFTDDDVDSTVVRNSAVSFQIEGEDEDVSSNGAPIVADKLFAMGYAVNLDYDGKWYEKDYLDALDGANVSFVSAHGWVGVHSNGFTPLPEPFS